MSLGLFDDDDDDFLFTKSTNKYENLFSDNPIKPTTEKPVASPPKNSIFTEDSDEDIESKPSISQNEIKTNDSSQEAFKYPSIIYSGKVDLYQANGSTKEYTTVGIAIAENKSRSTHFLLILYYSKENYIVSVPITKDFTLTNQLQDNFLYATFYDHLQKYWTFRYNTNEDADNLATYIGFSRFLEAKEPIVQDIFIPSKGRSINDEVKMKIDVTKTAESGGVFKYVEKKNMVTALGHTKNAPGWDICLAGMKQTGRRLVVLSDDNGIVCYTILVEKIGKKKSGNEETAPESKTPQEVPVSDDVQPVLKTETLETTSEVSIQNVEPQPNSLDQVDVGNNGEQEIKQPDQNTPPQSPSPQSQPSPQNQTSPQTTIEPSTQHQSTPEFQNTSLHPQMSPQHTTVNQYTEQPLTHSSEYQPVQSYNTEGTVLHQSNNQTQQHDSSTLNYNQTSGSTNTPSYAPQQSSNEYDQLQTYTPQYEQNDPYFNQYNSQQSYHNQPYMPQYQMPGQQENVVPPMNHYMSQPSAEKPKELVITPETLQILLEERDLKIGIKNSLEKVYHKLDEVSRKLDHTIFSKDIKSVGMTARTLLQCVQRIVYENETLASDIEKHTTQKFGMK